ncbi:hypothetical protein GGP80_000117 [Salinibacter ruber]|uniref:hypothetical protein n=1 Tax=Salinibacter ruber TaxID=146919 RepID=UPI001621738F|nr:hypothetical protein [Salinibacter ruber]MBB4062538.1 hypothetical protein [Salinibacter ruber]MCS3934158.1 hypothetical protein [Salinibacter ruber]MCS4042214.1 hypothetical protein [Salinibacter ruber]
MSTVIRLSLRPADDAKVVPLEVLRDFADVRTSWSYLAEDSQYYSELKETPGLVLRHRADRAHYVDLGFVETAPDTVQLAVLDRPDADTPLSPDDRTDLLDTFLDAMRDYLSGRPDHVRLEVNRDAASS